MYVLPHGVAVHRSTSDHYTPNWQVRATLLLKPLQKHIEVSLQSCLGPRLLRTRLLC